MFIFKIRLKICKTLLSLYIRMRGTTMQATIEDQRAKRHVGLKITLRNLNTSSLKIRAVAGKIESSPLLNTSSL